MYDPTPLDMKTISNSDLFVYTGDSMEGWAAQIVESLDETTQVLDLSEFVTLREEDEDDHEEDGHAHHHHDHGGYDPHYWLDLSNAQKMAQAIGDALVHLCPEMRETTRNVHRSMCRCWMIWIKNLWRLWMQVHGGMWSLADGLPTAIFLPDTIWSMRRFITAARRRVIPVCPM